MPNFHPKFELICLRMIHNVLQTGFFHNPFFAIMILWFVDLWLSVSFKQNKVSLQERSATVYTFLACAYTGLFLHVAVNSTQ